MIRSLARNFGLKPRRELYVLNLYVSGTTPRAARAIQNLKKICETHLCGRYKLSVIDIYQQPLAAATEQIVAAPTLIKRAPAPIRRLIGDMSNGDLVLQGLGVTGGDAL